jgi:prevent-host-death family protein
MTQVTVHHAKTHLSKLLAEVEAGGEVVIARGNVPVARLTALTPPKRKPRVPGLFAHLGAVGDEATAPLQPEDTAEWDFEAAALKD